MSDLQLIEQFNRDGYIKGIRVFSDAEIHGRVAAGMAGAERRHR